MFAWLLSIEDDLRLKERLQTGDATAFATLVDLHAGAMLFLARRFLGSAALAEEVVQDTWMAVLRNIEQFEGRSSLKTWIFAILHNQARRRASRESRQIAWSELTEREMEEVVHPEAGRFNSRGSWAQPPARWKFNPEEHLMRQKLLELVQETIEELPAAQRSVIVMRDVQGFSSGETCEALQITDSNHRVLLHRARASIRSAIEAYLARE